MPSHLINFRYYTSMQTKSLKNPVIPIELKQFLWQYFASHPTSSEFELLKSLQQAGFSEFSTSFEPLVLFRSHFLLFHILFRLQDEWFTEDIAILEINSTKITFKPYVNPTESQKPPGVVSVINQDAQLKAYYLDYSEFLNTQEEDVVTLLSDFWIKYAQLPEESERQAALSLLKIEIPFKELTRADIKKAYQKACYLHHPDKGGDADKFVLILNAYQLLKLDIQDFI